jgi:energy-converting hydrogenase Eha subunit H
MNVVIAVVAVAVWSAVLILAAALVRQEIELRRIRRRVAAAKAWNEHCRTALAVANDDEAVTR